MQDEERRDNKGDYRFKCLCACGAEVWVRGTELKNGKSTGCVSCSSRRRMLRGMEDPKRREQLRLAGLQGNDARKLTAYDENDKKVMGILSGAKTRCTNANNKQYKDYGGRGILFLFVSVVDGVAWVRKHLGERPEGLTLDRIDNDGNYGPGNLRWATRQEQGRNKRQYKGCTYGHRMQRLCGLRPDYTYEGLRKYVKLGYTDDQIINLPKPKGGRPRKC